MDIVGINEQEQVSPAFPFCSIIRLGFEDNIGGRFGHNQNQYTHGNRLAELFIKKYIKKIWTGGFSFLVSPLVSIKSTRNIRLRSVGFIDVLFPFVVMSTIGGPWKSR